MRLPGNYLGKRPVGTPSRSAAPGIWTIDEMGQYVDSGDWPYYLEAPTVVATSQGTPQPTANFYTWTNMDIGTEDPERTIIGVGFFGATTAVTDFVRMRIDGNDMDLIASAVVNDTFCTGVGIFSLPYPTGNTANIYMLVDSTCFIGLSVYAAYNLVDANTAVDSQSSTATIGPIHNFWPDVVSGPAIPGIAIWGGANFNNNSLSLSDDFSGATLDYEADFSTGDYFWSAAIEVADSSSITIDGTSTDTGTNRPSSALVLLQ